MASTYTWANIITFVAPYVKNIPTTSLDAAACDHVHSIIWRSFFWRWTTTTLTAISLVDGTQDYGLAAGDQTAFYRLVRVRITRTDVTPDISREIDLVEWLPPQLEIKGNLDSIRAACYEQSLSKIRLDRAASVPSGTTYQIDGEFQTNPTKITSTATTVVFPDQYVDVAVEGLKWKYYQLGDDPRAGGPSADGLGRVTYTGQYATFMAALQEMRRQEDQHNAHGFRWAGDGLGVGRGSNPGLFGWY